MNSKQASEPFAPQLANQPILTGARPVYDPLKIKRLTEEVQRHKDFELVRPKFHALYQSPGVQYQPRDWIICDYDLNYIDRVSYPVRGPVPEVVYRGRYFVVLGSATSFGTCVQRNYAHIISEATSLPCINLSHAGASPEFFARWHLESTRRYLEGAAFCIVETMAGRSVSNSRLHSVEGRRMAIDTASSSNKIVDTTEVYTHLVQSGDRPQLARLVTESLDQYLEYFDTLTAQCPCPIILLWLSKRAPDTFDRNRIQSMSVPNLLSAINIHPQLVDEQLFDAMYCLVEAVAEASTTVGIPSKATNRFTGEPATWFNGKRAQAYYPSPEMHKEAAAELIPIANELIEISRKRR